MTDWSPYTDRARAWFESLRDTICTEFEAKSAQSKARKRNTTSVATTAVAVPTMADQTDVISPYESHEGERRNTDRQIGCRTKLARNMKTTVIVLSRNAPGLRKISGMQATSTMT